MNSIWDKKRIIEILDRAPGDTVSFQMNGGSRLNLLHIRSDEGTQFTEDQDLPKISGVTFLFTQPASGDQI